MNFLQIIAVLETYMHACTDKKRRTYYRRAKHACMCINLAMSQISNEDSRNPYTHTYIHCMRAQVKKTYAAARPRAAAPHGVVVVVRCPALPKKPIQSCHACAYFGGLLPNHFSPEAVASALLRKSQLPLIIMTFLRPPIKRALKHAHTL